ncbi:hypothetical protein B566_EDAN000909 [Ephemera danica]|nr:hypothetical protein B566_EDAN000909 [Ephemera danica]
MEKENVNFLYKTMVERDPQKRKVKPVQNPLLDFDLGESSDDSDFRIEDHETDDDDDSMCSGDEGDVAGGAESAGSSDSSDNEGKAKSAGDTKTGSPSVGELLAQAKQQMQPGSSSAINAAKLLICCACLGDRSDAINEIVESCYGVSDTASVSSTVSSCSTEPWFCEACKAGVTNPNCELCPNHGGIFKETDVGKWVHLVCALYVPGVAFGEVDKLSNVTLFEMQYTKWGGKACQLCEDQRFVRTGVCIGCDAGMCRTVFHVTCAQREGLLAEAHCDELEHADPFYAHCRLHTDKVLMRKRRRNWLAVQLRMHERQAELERRGSQNVTSEQQLPTQKMPRLLTTSASACRKLIRKAELMGVDCQALETQEAQVASLIDVRKKWHIPPAFSVEFIGYYLDRNIRIAGMKRHLEDSLKTNNQLLKKQQSLRCRYDQLVKDRKEMQQQIDAELASVRSLRQTILAICPSQQLPPEPCMAPPPAPAPVVVAPTVYTPHPVPARRESKHHRQEALTLNECGICRQTKDQHLLAKCDTCHRFYHLGCLNPPLTRMPKKTKLMGW